MSVPTHDDKPPLFPDEVARRDDIAATAPISEEIARRFATPNIVVSSKSKKFESEAQFARLKEIEGALELREPKGLILGIPGRSAERLTSEKVASEVAPGNTTPAHRPALGFTDISSAAEHSAAPPPSAYYGRPARRAVLRCLRE